MNSTKTLLPYRFSSKFSALFLSSLLLAGCGASHQAQSTSESSSNSQSATSMASSSTSADSDSTVSSDSQSESDTGSNDSASASDSSSAESKATEVPLDNSQVKDTQNLVQDAQSALASAQLVAATPSAEPTDGESQATEGNPDLSATTQDAINKVATGAAAEDFMATAYEYAQNGWEVEGEPTFVGEPKISSVTFDGKEAKRLEVCVDSSNVKVTDEAGNNMLSSTAPTRSLTYYTLVSIDNTWKIASVDFPDNPDC